MDTYKFSVSRNGKQLEGIVPGEILIDAVVLALKDVYPEAIPQREQWLRSQIAQYIANDAVVPNHPVIFFQEEGNDTVSASLSLTRLSGTVPPLQPPPQLARPRVERPGQWEGLVHRQMYRYLRGQIEAGIYTVGDELPTPEQLEWHFGTENPTAGHHAYNQLATEGLVANRDGRYIVAATTPPPVQTTQDAVDRLDALETTIHETLVALRSLRGDLAGVQTPSCGQWWQIRSLARGADPSETSEAACIRDNETGELVWFFNATLAKRPLHHFQPLRRLTHISDWGCDTPDKDTTDKAPDRTPSDQPSQPADAATTTAAAGTAFYSTDETDSGYEF